MKTTRRFPNPIDMVTYTQFDFPHRGPDYVEGEPHIGPWLRFIWDHNAHMKAAGLPSAFDGTPSHANVVKAYAESHIHEVYPSGAVVAGWVGGFVRITIPKKAPVISAPPTCYHCESTDGDHDDDCPRFVSEEA